MKEYREVPYFDKVFINEYGEVFQIIEGEKVKKEPRINACGHLEVDLKKSDGSWTNGKIHRLLALTFIPIPDKLKGYDVKNLDVHHEDGCKTNNALENLIWLTHGEHTTLHNQGNKYSLGRHLSDEQRREISERQKGEKHPNFGKHLSEEHRRKISETLKASPPFLGRHHTEETIKKMSKPVEQWSKDGTILIAKYESASEVERQTGIRQGDISRCCNGIRHSAGGYKWRYAD